MIYSPGNSAKQWIALDIEKRFKEGPKRILDLACGNGWIWEKFVQAHPDVSVVGVDFNERAIRQGQERYRNVPAIQLSTADAQSETFQNAFDFVVALSALEHVVDHPAFMKTAWNALKPGGIAYLNYDVGHFRHPSFMERLKAPLSQFLAMIGFEKWYRKEVNDAVFQRQAKAQGFRILNVRKHNLVLVKGLMKGASPEAVDAWYAFEERLGELFTPDKLDPVLWSTTVVLEKPLSVPSAQ